jgi:hypothetical protein
MAEMSVDDDFALPLELELEDVSLGIEAMMGPRPSVSTSWIVDILSCGREGDRKEV